MKEISHDRNENRPAQGKSVEREKKLAPSRGLRGAETQARGSAMNRIKNSLVASGGLSLLIVLLGVAPAAAGPKNSQVALGTTESDNKFPWIVGVGTGESCKGVLIAPRWVLTAAHCITRSNSATVSYNRVDPVTGVATGSAQVTGQNSTFKHPDFRDGFPDADIALVRLPKPFDPDPLLQPAELPVAAAAPGQQGTVANFTAEKQTLPAGQVAVLRAPISVVGSKTFFARSTTASLCPGDSGSAFMTLRGGLNVVTGIVSQGPTAGCATANIEFEAVDVFQHLSWISSIARIGPRDLQPVDAVPADYDGDTAIDLAVKTSAGDWKIDYAYNGFGFWDVVYSGYGFSDARAVPADYDHDLKADLSVKSDDGMWFIDYAVNGFGSWDVAYSGYGFSDGHPVPADYDGDLKADLSVKSDGGVWFIDYADNGFGSWDVAFSGYGFSDAHAVPADYCVDGRIDLSVKSDGGAWFIDCGSDGFGSWNAAFSGYGFSNAHPVPADYDGDGKADLSVKTDDGVWFIDYSVNGFGSWDVVFSGWGDSNARAVPGDYDRDHRIDLAVYNLLNDWWYIDYVKDGFGGLNAVISQAP